MNVTISLFASEKRGGRHITYYYCSNVLCTYVHSRSLLASHDGPITIRRKRAVVYHTKKVTKNTNTCHNCYTTCWNITKNGFPWVKVNAL